MPSEIPSPHTQLDLMEHLCVFSAAEEEEVLTLSQIHQCTQGNKRVILQLTETHLSTLVRDRVVM